MRTLIKNVTIVNEGNSFKGAVIIDNDIISDVINYKAGDIIPHDMQLDSVLDASECFLLPGIIDEHVHFREPGFTNKADIESESRAAAFGGVTSYFDMPNTKPQTTTLEALDDKFERAAAESHINYSFFFGATNSNVDLFSKLDVHRIPGVKMFMGSSTGNMLVDKADAIDNIFRDTKLPIMTHCEDSDIINSNMARVVAKFGADPDVVYHPIIRDEEACYKSTTLAVELAKKYGTRLHVAHITTAKELSLFEKVVDNQLPLITAEVVVSHLVFTDEDYKSKCTLIKCNPSIKEGRNRDALRHALNDGRISCVATDHAPHELKEKQGGCCSAASGMPMIQFSLVMMLKLVDEGVLTIERLVELMCHNPARIFDVSHRGFIRKGYKADLTIVHRCAPWTVTREIIQSKCGWSPIEGETFNWRVSHTFCNGKHILNNGVFDTNSRGEEIKFRM